MTEIAFDYHYRGRRHRCSYEVRSPDLIVTTNGRRKLTTHDATDDPLRLARVLAHELLNEAERSASVRPQDA